MKSKILVFACILIISAPVIVFGQGSDTVYRPLVGIPGIDDQNLFKQGFGDYINALYRLSISIAALLAVIKIVAAGAKYMLSDIVTHKEDAKKDIQGALLGLLVIIGAVIILMTINTDITKNNLAIEPVVMNSTSTLNAALDNFLARMKSQEEAKCASADTTKGEACRVEWCNLDCRDTCIQKKGVYTPGSLLGYTIGASNYKNKCVFVELADGAALGNTVGDTVQPEDIIATKDVSAADIESALGLGTGEVGDTELALIASYFTNGISSTDLTDNLGTGINMATINRIKTDLNCSSDYTVGYTKQTSSNGSNIKFQCVKTNP